MLSQTVIPTHLPDIELYTQAAAVYFQALPHAAFCC